MPTPDFFFRLPAKPATQFPSPRVLKGEGDDLPVASIVCRSLD